MTMINKRGNLRGSKNLARFALLLCATLAFAAMGPGTAHATPRATQFNGKCETGEFCLYYNQNRGEPLIDYGTAGGRTCDSSYANNNFPGTTIPVNNNTRSYQNLAVNVTVRIYDNINYGTPIEDLGPGTRNLAQSNWDRASSHRSIWSGC